MSHGALEVWVVAVLVTCAVSAVGFVALKGAYWFSVGAWQSRSLAWRRGSLPRWLTCALPLANPLADLFGRRVPVRMRDRLQRKLRAAELDEDVTATQWLGISCVFLASGSLVLVAPLGLLAPQTLLGLALGVLPWVWLRDRSRRRDWEILRDLPGHVDMLTLALESGSALSTALRATTTRVPPGVMQRAFTRLQGDLRAGRSRVEALQAMADRLDSAAIAPLVAAMIQAEQTGASLSTVLRAQSAQRLDERFARAERLALEAPVKMLAPLILCIFPCTFLVIGFPIYARIAADWGSR
jgi:tight adherence protein C